MKIHRWTVFLTLAAFIRGQSKKMNASLECQEMTKLGIKLEDNLNSLNVNVYKLVDKKLEAVGTICSRSGHFLAENLEKNTSYVFESDKFFTRPFSTLSSDLELNQVSNANVELRGSDNEQSVTALLTWTPIPQLPCTYMIWMLNDGSFSAISPMVDELYKTELKNLPFSREISVNIYAENELYEGEELWINFTTSSCSNYLKNHSVCPPEKPENLEVTIVGCTVHLAWSKPRIEPDHYVITVHPNYVTIVNGSDTYFNVPMEEKESTIYVSVSSVSKNRESDKAFATVSNSKCSPSNFKYYAISATSIILLVVIGTATLVARKCERPTIAKVSELETIETSVDPSLIECDDYQLKGQNLEFLEIIGEGEFGVVRRAYLKSINGQTKEVAVKTLRDEASPDEGKKIEEEVKMMKSVGSHSNIVSLIGYCSTHKFIVVEFCSLGNLQNYLREVWNNILGMRDIYSTLNEQKNKRTLSNFVNNFIYDKTDKEKRMLEITVTDLMSFARQIARGMEFLAKNRVVHRDLAARNVLLTVGLTAKISDFGLSRDIYEENLYRKTSVDKLPFKWMAIESLVHHIFTTQSDVWSFGVLLWEIMTLGATPYPALESGQIYNLLLRGYRMERPNFCSQQMYEIMQSCWETLPHRRPSFTELISTLDGLIEKESQRKYLKLDSMNYINL